MNRPCHEVGHAVARLAPPLHGGGRHDACPWAAGSTPWPPRRRARSGTWGRPAKTARSPSSWTRRASTGCRPRAWTGARTTRARELQIPDVETHNVEIAFSGVPVTGVVIDKDTDQPVAQAFVRAVAEGQGEGRFRRRLGANGRRRPVPVRRGSGRIHARRGRRGYASHEQHGDGGRDRIGRRAHRAGEGPRDQGPRPRRAAARRVSSVNVSADRRAAGESDPAGAQALPDGTFRYRGPRRQALQPLCAAPSSRATPCGWACRPAAPTSP